MTEIKKLQDKVKQFRDERDWKQFHTPKNLAMALSVEASELAELFLWDDNEESYKTAKEKNEHLQEEMADVFIYLLSMADILDIDLNNAVLNKLEKNCIKYPVNKARGCSKKYSDL